MRQLVSRQTRRLPGIEIRMQRAGVLFEPIEVESIGRHLPCGNALSPNRQLPIGPASRIEPAGDFSLESVRKRESLPVFIGDAERHRAPMQSHAVVAEPVSHRRFDLGQHLEQVEDADRTVRLDLDMAFQPAICDCGNPALARPAHINRDTIGRFVMNGSSDAFARGHAFQTRMTVLLRSPIAMCADRV